VKQGQSSIPANILMDIFNPFNSANGLRLLTRISAGVDDCPCFTNFIALIPIDSNITNFPYTCTYYEAGRTLLELPSCVIAKKDV